MKLQTRDIMIGLGLICLSALFAFSEDPSFDNFDRRNGNPDNDWIVNSPKVKTEIKDKEILIHGTEKTNWKRNGIERLVDDVNKACFDFFKLMMYSMFIFELMMIKVVQMHILTFILLRDHREEIIVTTQVLRMVLGLVGLISVGLHLKRSRGKKVIVISVCEKNKRISSSL